MISEDDDSKRMEAVWQIWQEGLSRTGSNAAIRLFRSGQPIDDAALLQGWLETIDLMMSQMLEVPADLNDWIKLSQEEKHKQFNGTAAGYESFVDDIQRVINVMKGESIEDQGKVKPDDEAAVRKIISDAVGRATNREVESHVDARPIEEMMSSEKIVEPGITEEKFLDSLRQDSKVISAESHNGEIFLNTRYGEISFRFVFSDEADHNMIS